MASGMLDLSVATPPVRVQDSDADAANASGDAGVPAVPQSNPVFLYVLTLCSTIGGFLFGYDTVLSSCFCPHVARMLHADGTTDYLCACRA